MSGLCAECGKWFEFGPYTFCEEHAKEVIVTDRPAKGFVPPVELQDMRKLVGECTTQHGEVVTDEDTIKLCSLFSQAYAILSAEHINEDMLDIVFRSQFDPVRILAANKEFEGYYGSGRWLLNETGNTTAIADAIRSWGYDMGCDGLMASLWHNDEDIELVIASLMLDNVSDTCKCMIFGKLGSSSNVSVRRVIARRHDDWPEVCRSELGSTLADDSDKDISVMISEQLIEWGQEAVAESLGTTLEAERSKVYDYYRKDKQKPPDDFIRP